MPNETVKTPLERLKSWNTKLHNAVVKWRFDHPGMYETAVGSKTMIQDLTEGQLLAITLLTIQQGIK